MHSIQQLGSGTRQARANTWPKKCERASELVAKLGHDIHQKLLQIPGAHVQQLGIAPLECVKANQHWRDTESMYLRCGSCRMHSSHSDCNLRSVQWLQWVLGWHSRVGRKLAACRRIRKASGFLLVLRRVACAIGWSAVV